MKELTRIEHVKKNMLSMCFSNGIAVIFPFIIRTLMIQYLGTTFLGFNSLCISILYVLNAADLGITDAMVYRLYKPIALGDRDCICKLLNIYRKVYFLIGGIILAAGFITMPFLERMIAGEKPENVNVYFVYFVYIINAALSYMFFAYKKLILLADQHKDYETTISGVCILFMYILQIICIIEKQSYGYVILLPACTVISNSLIFVLVKKKYPQYACFKGKVENAEPVIKKDVFALGVYRLRDLSRNAFDNIVISSILGLICVANYQNYYSVLTIPLLLRTIFTGAVTPSLGNFVATGSKEESYNIYKALFFLQLFLSGWFTICYFCLVQEFIIICFGERHLLPVRIALLLSLYYYLLGI